MALRLSVSATKYLQWRMNNLHFFLYLASKSINQRKMTVLLVIILIVALLAGYVVSVQRNLVKSDELCNNALKQINVQQMSRFDALKALIKIAKEYAEYESETLTKVVAERKINNSANPTVKEVAENEEFLGSLASRLVAIAERYPELKASEGYVKTMEAVNGYEENVRMSRMTFNDTVTRYNNLIRMFPSNLVASMLKFGKREYLAEDKSKTEYPEL